MNKTHTITPYLSGLTALLLVASTVNASDEHEHHRPKGFGNTLVTAVTPLANSSGVAINTKIISRFQRAGQSSQS